MCGGGSEGLKRAVFRGLFAALNPGVFPGDRNGVFSVESVGIKGHAGQLRTQDLNTVEDGWQGGSQGFSLHRIEADDEKDQELGSVLEMPQATPAGADGDQLRCVKDTLEISNFGMVTFDGAGLVIPDDGAQFVTMYPVRYCDVVPGHDPSQGSYPNRRPSISGAFRTKSERYSSPHTVIGQALPLGLRKRAWEQVTCPFLVLHS